MILTLSVNYGYVFLAAAFIAIECIVIGIVVLGKARRQAFTQPFMEQFQQVHKREVNFDSIPNYEGYPDMGNGHYSQRLSYGEWYFFNNAQRAHYNFVESIATTITLLMIGGVYYPIPAAVFGLGIFIARILYAVGYYTSGPSSKVKSIGAFTIDACLIGLFVLCVITGVKFIKGLPADSV